MEQSVLSKHFKKDYVGEGVLASESSPHQYESCLYCRQKLISTYFVHRDDLLKHISTVHPQEQQVAPDMHSEVAVESSVESTCSLHNLPASARHTEYDPLAQLILCPTCRSEYEAMLKQAQCDSITVRQSTAQTDREDFDLTQIPYSALVRVGRIFKEGETKYGRGNWRHGVDDKAYQLERANHALKHLLVYIHYLETSEYVGHYTEISHRYNPETSTGVRHINSTHEDDLAKVLWFCVTQCELERLGCA